MAMTNTERQRRWRIKRDALAKQLPAALATIDKLKAQLAAARKAAKRRSK